MRPGKRQRVEDLPFAGLHDISANPEAASFVVYGVAATLHPLDQVNDDEGSELVPWGNPTEGSTEPVLVDRFDCRLLLEPSDLLGTSAAVGRSRGQGRKEDATAAPSSAATALEAELEEQRWGDLFNPPHLHHHHGYHSADEEEEERQKRSRGAAIPFTYLNTDDATASGLDAADGQGNERDGQRVYYLEDLEPPPPPPYLQQQQNQPNSSLISLLEVLKSSTGGSGSGSNVGSNTSGLLPFTARQYAIMERTAQFLSTYKDHGGAEILYQRAFSDPTFAFVSPGHVWHDFFKGLVQEKKTGLAGEAQEGMNPSEKRKGEEQEANVLSALLGGYGSEDEEEAKPHANLVGKEQDQDSGPPEILAKAIIDRLIKSTTHTDPTTATTASHNLALLVRERLSTDHLLASILTTDARYYSLFKEAVDGAVAAGTMDKETEDIWLGIKKEEKEEERIEPEPAAPAPAAVEGIKKERKLRKPAATSTAAVEVDESKKEERKKKARLLLERQEKVAEERRQGQAVAKRHAEEERNQHLAAISVHKRMFLTDNSDDE
jgi:hypothetical protein